MTGPRRSAETAEGSADREGTKGRLEEVIKRIDRLAQEPDEVGGRLRFLTRPFYRLFRRAPVLKVDRTAALLGILRDADEAALAGDGAGAFDDAVLAAHLEEACEELTDNVVAMERACIADGKPPAAHLLWLWRVYGLVVRAARAIEEGDEDARRLAAGIDPRMLAQPLTIERRAKKKKKKKQNDGDGDDPVSAEESGGVAPVGLVDALLDAARDETDHLGRKRRLLEVARRTLLDASAALDLDPALVAARQEWMAQQISAIDAHEASGVAPDVGLVHQARRAHARGNNDLVAGALRALDGLAASRGDLTLGRLTGRALRALGNGRVGSGAAGRRAHRAANATLARRSLGADVDAAIQEGVDAARENLEVRVSAAKGAVRENLNFARRHLESQAALEQLLTTFGVDGAVDVGGVMTPLRVVEESMALRAVRHPTDQLLLLPAEGPEDLSDAIIIDPRAILMHLAEGKLLARRWVAEERRRRERVKLATEVRIYLLDGSTSMIGPRARMRDAILLAELVTLRARLMDAERFYDPVLYYRYFTKRLGETQRVATPADCLAAISKVVSQVRIGETDIEKALLASFEQIGEANAHDPRLARASIVLVTDGEAEVDHEVVLRAREAVGDLPVRVNIIALGLENPALEALAARQRARGEDVFYQYLSDDFLKDVIAGYPDRARADWVPGDLDPDALHDELEGLLGELAGLERVRDTEALASVADYQTTLEYMGVDLSDLSDGERARIEALHRDKRALEHRFDRWFPTPPTPGTDRRGRPTAPPPTPARGTAADLDAGQVHIALRAVAETVDAVGSRGLRRQADAIELLERILIETGLSPLRYTEIVEEHADHLAPALADVRRAAHAT